MKDHYFQNRWDLQTKHTFDVFNNETRNSNRLIVLIKCWDSHLKCHSTSSHIPYFEWLGHQPLSQSNFPQSNFSITTANCSKFINIVFKSDKRLVWNKTICSRHHSQSISIPGTILWCVAWNLPASNVWWEGWKSMLITVDPWRSVQATVLGRSSSDQEACWGG